MRERASVQMWVRDRVLGVGVAAGSLVLLLTGCSGFFPPLPTTTGGGGTAPGATTGSFVYVANGATNQVAGFAVTTNAAGAGVLTAVSGSPYGVASSPTAMVVTPSNSFLYVAVVGGIYAYAINATTGQLTIANSGGTAAVTQLGSVSLDVSPDGQWLFALSQDGQSINEYSINATTGALGAQTPTTYAVANTVVSPKMIKVAPNGLFIFVALGTGGDLVYPFTSSTGAVGTTNVQHLPTGDVTTGDNALAIDSGTTFLYIARSGASTGLAVYGIGANGALTPVAGSPFAAGGGPYSVLLDSTGKYVYAANRTAGTVSGYAIGTGAVLTALAGSPYASGTSVTSLARDNSAKYVLAAASGGSPDLTMYSFDATVPGKLDSAATATTGADPTGPVMVVATH